MGCGPFNSGDNLSGSLRYAAAATRVERRERTDGIRKKQWVPEREEDLCGAMYCNYWVAVVAEVEQENMVAAAAPTHVVSSRNVT